MKNWLLLFLSFALTGCAMGGSQASGNPADQAITSSYPDLGAAPELQGDTWLNTSQPLRLNTLRGKVVLLDMWTFACINCQHVLPYLKQWDNTYKQDGLVIIGNHFPEFDFEKSLANLKQAAIDQGISFAIVQDNTGDNWQAYQNSYWPTMYLIDKNSHIRYIHIGEGDYSSTENAIRALLAESTR